VTRHLTESIRAATNATVVVENKPGADGNLAALAVLKAEPDGYTVFVMTNSTQAQTPGAGPRSSKLRRSKTSDARQLAKMAPPRFPG
jgi:tripartite-type tricarboxylate transporter receptor subunit TctC